MEVLRDIIKNDQWAVAEGTHNMPQETDPYPIEIGAENDSEWNYFFNQVRPE